MRAYMHDRGQSITTDASSVDVDRAFLAHIQLGKVKAADDDAVATLTCADDGDTVTWTLSEDGIANPDCVRALEVKGVADLAGTVTVTGTDYAGNVITEVFTLNGATAVPGAKPFATVTKVVVASTAEADEDVVKVGTSGKIFGLPYLLAHDTVLALHINNVIKAKGSGAGQYAIATHAETMTSNTVTFGTAVTANDNIDIYLMV